MNKNIIPVILCGGSGTRLWPASRGNTPKQFLKLMGDNSLLQQTAMRTLKLSQAEDDKLITITLDNMKREVSMQLSKINPMMTRHIIGEPSARNTAAAIAYAAEYVSRQFGEDAICWIAPSDHYISDEAAMKDALMKAAKAAENDYLVTFGINPTRPETGYGYIAFSGDAKNSEGVKEIHSFVEKPNHEVAKQYVESGKYLWNSGMFVFKAGTVLRNFEKHSPSIIEMVRKALTIDMNGRPHANMEIYNKIEEQPFDKAIMEKTDMAAVVPCNLGWSDIGSWESLWEISDKNEKGNVTEGRVVTVNTENCLIKSEERLVTTVGLKDITIVETSDSILVAHKSAGDDIKKAVNAMKKIDAPEVTNAPQEERPWGMFKVLSESKGYKMKEIVVKPGGKLSLQMHHHRAEFWVIIEGEAIVTVDEDIHHMKAQDSIFIPLKAKHRLENKGTTNLKIVEIQCGDYLGEDDIVRFDDIYGRSAA